MQCVTRQTAAESGWGGVYVKTAGANFLSRTVAPASLPSTCHVELNDSTGWTAAARAKRGAPGWAWPSSSTWPSATVARSMCTVKSARVQLSLLPCLLSGCVCPSRLAASGRSVADAPVDQQTFFGVVEPAGAGLVGPVDEVDALVQRGLTVGRN